MWLSSLNERLPRPGTPVCSPHIALSQAGRRQCSGDRGMWANSVWGLAGAALACVIAWLTVPDQTLRFWLLVGAIAFGALSVIVLVWPIAKSLTTDPYH